MSRARELFTALGIIALIVFLIVGVIAKLP